MVPSTETILAVSTGNVTQTDAEMMETMGEGSPQGLPRFIVHEYGFFVPIYNDDDDEGERVTQHLRRHGFSRAMRVLWHEASKTDCTFLFFDNLNPPLEGLPVFN